MNIGLFHFTREIHNLRISAVICEVILSYLTILINFRAIISILENVVEFDSKKLFTHTDKLLPLPYTLKQKS